MKEKEIILSQWLQGQVSDTEVKSFFPDIDLDNLRATLDLQEKFEISATDPEAQWEIFESIIASKKQDSAVKKPFRRILLISVSVIVAFSLFLLFKSTNTIVKADSSEFLNYAFQDGSTIKLWPGSSISFDEENYLTNRVINLQGEGFFDVQKGNPFRVLTQAAEVEVLGTSFNVWAPDKNNTVIKCYTGRVLVTDNSNKSSILTAGKKVKVSEKNLDDVFDFDLENQKDNASLKFYDKAKINWVLSDLENLYNVQFDIPKDLKNKRFSGAISSIELTKALSYLCETMQWDYEIEQKRVLIKNKN